MQQPVAHEQRDVADACRNFDNDDDDGQPRLCRSCGKDTKRRRMCAREVDDICSFRI